MPPVTRSSASRTSWGPAQADTITGDNNANTLEGGDGDDVIIGQGGDDTLIGGAGADALIGSGGIDTVNYSASAAGVNVNLATTVGTGGDAEGDTLSGIEIVRGSNLADTIIGDGLANTLSRPERQRHDQWWRWQ